MLPSPLRGEGGPKGRMRGFRCHPPCFANMRFAITSCWIWVVPS